MHTHKARTCSVSATIGALCRQMAFTPLICSTPSPAAAWLGVSNVRPAYLQAPEFGWVCMYFLFIIYMRESLSSGEWVAQSNHATWQLDHSSGSWKAGVNVQNKVFAAHRLT